MTFHAETRERKRQGEMPESRKKHVRRLWFTGIVAALMVLLIGCPSPVQTDTGDDTGEGGGSGVRVTGITIPESATTLETGDTFQINPEVAPADATNKSVAYESSNTAVATVSDSGVVTAVAGGSATVTVTTLDGGFQANLAVTVNVSATGVTINAPQNEIGTGQTLQLSADVSPADATNPSVTWASSDDTVATVDATGLVEGVIEGSVSITATTDDGAHTNTVTIDVVTAEPVSSVTIDETSPQTIEKGSTLQLNATVAPLAATDQVVGWGSSNEAVATVDSNGLVTAVGGGTADITVTTNDGGLTNTITVNVNVAVEGVSIDQSDSSINVGETLALIESITPVDATDNGVSWDSSDPSVATVDSNGIVTGAAAGTAGITVTTNDGGFTDTITVTVNAPITAVTIDQPSQTIEENALLLLTATVEPTEANQEVTWTSSNESVATIIDSALLPQDTGTTEVIATSADGSVASAPITITVVAPTGITISGETNAPAGWAVAAQKTDTEDAPIIGTVTSGSPNTYSVVVPDTGTDYNVEILFENLDATNQFFGFFDSPVTVQTGATSIPNIDRFADVVVSNLDTSYAGRPANVSVLDSEGIGPAAFAAYGSGIITNGGQLFIAELLDVQADLPWNDGTSGSVYDVYVAIPLEGDGLTTEISVTGSPFGPLGTLTTTASGDPPQETAIDASGASYRRQLSMDALNIYETATGEFTARTAKVEIYTGGVSPDPANLIALASASVGLGSLGPDSARISLFATPTGTFWEPVLGQSYDVYLRIQTDGVDPEILVAGSSAMPPAPLAQITWSSSVALPVTIDVNAVGTFLTN